MMTSFFIRLAERMSGDDNTPLWETDPLSHPALAAMDQRELGDLPMVPAARERSGCGSKANACDAFGVAAKAA